MLTNGTPVDALTGLPGRESLDILKQEYQETDRVWTIIMIDVDHFKLINDIYGHLTGDQVLREVAMVLESNLREDDTMIRFGGDEFMGVFRDTRKTAALNYAERVMEDIQDVTVSRGVTFTLSMGVANSLPEDVSLDEVIDRADKALYRAKAAGRGRISFLSDSTDNIPSDKIQLNHFVGRQSELRRLRQLLDESLSEGSRFALIEGDAGVGKSRLASEVRHYAEFKKCRILFGECFEFGDPEPYAFLMTPVRKELDTLSEDILVRIRGSVESLHPATAELLPELGVQVTEDIQFFKKDRLKFRIFDDISRLLHAMSQISPFLTIIDDIQWISQPDLDLLSYLIRSTREARTMFVVTMRSQEKSVPRIKQHLLSLHRTIPYLTITLKNLELQETSNLIMFALRDPNIPREFLEVIYRQCGGNPFFLEELINSMIQSGSIISGPAGQWDYRDSLDKHLPESLAQLIASRLYPLSDLSRKILRVAALASTHFTLDLVSAAVGEAYFDVVESLEQPLQMGLVQTMDSGSGKKPEYRFTHDTVRHFLHRELSTEMKAVYHAKMAVYFEEKLEETGQDDHIIPMAYHFCESSVQDKARQASLKAARLSGKRNATRETIRWYESYISLTPEKMDPPEDVYGAYYALGNLYSLTGDGRKAEKYLSQAMELAETDAQKARILSRRGSTYQSMSRFVESRMVYQEAFDLTKDPLKQIDIMNSLSFLDYLEGDLDSAVEKISRIEKMLAVYPEDDEKMDMYRASFYTTRGIIYSAAKHGLDSAEDYEKALAIFQKHGDAMGESAVYNNMADVYPRTGQFEKALEVLKKAETINSRVGDALSLAISTYNIAVIYTSINQHKLAREYYQRYMEINVHIHNEMGMGYGNMGLGFLHEEIGDLNRAETYYREATEIFNQLGNRSQAFESAMSLVQVLLIINRIEDAEMEFHRHDIKDENLLGTGMKGKRLFTRGLLQLFKVEDEDTGQLEAAETLIRQSLITQEHEDLAALMKRYYFLAECCHRLDRTEAYRETVEQAVFHLESRLKKVVKPQIRKNICQRRYIRNLLETRDSFL